MLNFFSLKQGVCMQLQELCLSYTVILVWDVWR